MKPKVMGVEMRMKVLKFALIAAGAITVSGCWVHYHYGHGPAPVSASIVYVRLAPPPPLRPRIPPRPNAIAVWIEGYWRWASADYVWTDGFWDTHPPAGKVWAPGRWIHTNRGWYRRPGEWR